MDKAFLKRVQDAGWTILTVDGETVVAGCPRQGCEVKVRLQSGKVLPACASREADSLAVPVHSYDDARQALRHLREQKGLDQGDLSDISGLGHSFIAKSEKDLPSRAPSFETICVWAEALGYRVVLQPAELTDYALHVIATTRDRTARRRRRYAMDRRRRRLRG